MRMRGDEHPAILIDHHYSWGNLQFSEQSAKHDTVDADSKRALNPKMMLVENRVPQNLMLVCPMNLTITGYVPMFRQ
jgi:hypothetical protein